MCVFHPSGCKVEELHFDFQQPASLVTGITMLIMGQVVKEAVDRGGRGVGGGLISVHSFFDNLPYD